MKMFRATVGVEVEITASVGGVAGPADSALGGRLFYAWEVESPQAGPVVITWTAGTTSVQRFTPLAEGHYAIGIARDAGGAVILHLDVEIGT
jgi:hypothetical protein